ncbi:MAG: metallophosphoesterase [Oscillospiraceae bacterium]|nr:metallophosphoesterase [Oscillospiraceae bacterium]
MICVTGDMHGDYSRFKNSKIKKLKKGDFLIVCGDFGFVWDGSKREKRILKKIGRKRFYTLFVEGCHENYDLLDECPEEEFCGGKVSVISGRLMRVKRGSVLDLQGNKFFFFGGGQTKEIDIRRESKTWWEQELPTPEEVKQGVITLKENGSEVDYIVTHEPPASMKEFLGFEVRQISHMHTFFDAVKNDCKFKMWFFGKAHKNKVIPPRYQCLFDEVVRIESRLPKKKKGK